MILFLINRKQDAIGLTIILPGLRNLSQQITISVQQNKTGRKVLSRNFGS